MTYPLPTGWKYKLLCEIGDAYTGNTPPTKDKNNYGNEYLFVTPADIKENKYITDSERKLSSKGFSIARQFKKGDILYVSIGSTIGKIAIANKELTTNQQINILRVNKYNNNEFVYYQLIHSFKSFSYLISTQAVPILNKTAFENISILLPPLEEQKRIAEVLSLCDDIIENLTELIDKKEQYKKGVMQRLLSGEVRFKGFTDEWKEIKISKLVEKNIIFIEKGKAISKNKIVEGNIPVIAGGKIPAYYHSEYTHDFPCITISASGAYSGYVWFHNYKIWASDCNVLYTEDNKYNIEFLFYYLNYIQELIYYMQTGGAQPHIYAKDIITLTIPNISIEEQKKIAGLLSVIDEEIENLKKQLELRKQQKKGLMQKLLTGEVRV
ncbi:restriction endonuclease subunit S [Brachyspira intermedia]|uniref:restriction endonuclease subunit S n=1 Tax=Brachyspira intermedia TaxID=84377 RepID=UPI003006FB21